MINDDKLRIDVEKMFGHPKYKEDKYTKMIKNIVDSHFTFTPKQRGAIVTHIRKFYDKLVQDLEL